MEQLIDDAPTIKTAQTILELSNLLAEKDKIIKELSQIRTDIEAEPRKHGHWVEEGYSMWCSECGGTWDNVWSFTYCPNCGAKMDEVEE